MSADNKQGFKPQLRAYLNALGTGLAGDLVFNVMTANVAPSPTSSAWDYTLVLGIILLSLK
jgi:hypothetical protein